MSDSFLDRDYLDPLEVDVLMKSKEGRAAFLTYIFREKASRALGKIFFLLGIDLPSKEVQEQCIDIMMSEVFNVPVDKLLSDLLERKAAAQKMERNGVNPMCADDLEKCFRGE